MLCSQSGFIDRRRKKVICRVINRKYAREIIINSKNLKNNKRYGNSKIFVNNSFCPEFGFLNYVCRKAVKEREIHRLKVKNGINLVQREEGGSFIEIGHVMDLQNLGITVPSRD